MARSITVIGSGSWGSALAILLARNGVETTLWGRDTQQIDEIALRREHPRYLPGIKFPASLRLQADLALAVAASDDLLLAIPSHAFRITLQQILPHLHPGMAIGWATKGLESGSHAMLHQIAAEILPSMTATAVISGPTFAREVALGLPTAVTVASVESAIASRFAAALHGPTFRAYTSSDVVGVELGGACKNVLAIAAGIADGLGFGANTRAALITRGLYEMMRLGTTIGGQPETFMGLAGLGDLVLTATDDQSRNRRLGLALGRGVPLDVAIASIGQAVEGARSAPAIDALAASLAIEMPITHQVCRVVGEGVPPQRAVEALLNRDPKAENA
jgi:glycerol-3-phosphate dehydrogenase (NAD(P)+)